MSQQEEDPSRYTRTLVVKPALSQMYDQVEVPRNGMQKLLHSYVGAPSRACNQCNRATLMSFYTNFGTEFFHTVFTRRFVLKGTLRRDQKVISSKVQFLAL